jgi:hypothetical protein
MENICLFFQIRFPLKLCTAPQIHGWESPANLLLRSWPQAQLVEVPNLGLGLGTGLSPSSWT